MLHGSNGDGVFQAAKRQHRHSGGRYPYAKQIANAGVAVVVQYGLYNREREACVVRIMFSSPPDPYMVEWLQITRC